MSWNKCRTLASTPHSIFTSDLSKVLMTLKILHGSRNGGKGSTLEDIAMYMVKHFSLDGDIKSQVLAILKYGVKMNLIQRRKEKFGLILPASSIHLAPCKFKTEEMERVGCIFPAKWYSNACNDAVCGSGEQSTCCGKRRNQRPAICGQEEDEHTCRSKKRSKSSCPQCFPPSKKKRKQSPCAGECPLPPCSHRPRDVCPQPPDDFSKFCDRDDDDDPCGHGQYPRDAYKNCSCCPKK